MVCEKESRPRKASFRVHMVSTHSSVILCLDLEIIREQRPTSSNARASSEATGSSTHPRAPPTSFVKIHVDADISKKNRRDSAAAVCRDEKGNYLESSSLVIFGVHEAATLEFIACREAFSLAEDLSPQNFIIASDAKHVVHDFSKDS